MAIIYGRGSINITKNIIKRSSLGARGGERYEGRRDVGKNGMEWK